MLFAVMASPQSPAAAAASPKSPDIAVVVRCHGAMIVVGSNRLVRTSPWKAWDVLTDQDGIARFVASPTMSRTLERSNTTLLVAGEWLFVGMAFVPTRSATT